MDRISLDVADVAHVFVEDGAKGLDPTIQSSVGNFEDLCCFLQRILTAEQFHKFRVLAVLWMMNLDIANIAVQEVVIFLSLIDRIG